MAQPRAVRIPAWLYCLGGGVDGQGAGACCAGAAVIGAAPGAVEDLGLAAGLTATFFFGAGFLTGLGGGGAGVNSTCTGLGRISGEPSPVETGSISSESG